MKPLLNCISRFGMGRAIMLALYVMNFWPAHQRAAALLAQAANPPSQDADNSLGGLLDEDAAPKTKADENAPPRSLLAPWINFMSDKEFATYPGLTGAIAEQLDKEEKEFLQIIQSNPKLWNELLREAIERNAASARAVLENILGENWASLANANRL